MPVDKSLIGREYYVFRDSTHNLIFIEDPNLGKLLRKILDTAEFQRLRRIRQNGLGFLVYPSMETSRFPHSLGSFAVAKKVIEALRAQQPTHGDFGFPKCLEIDLAAAHGFCVAAALHDIGHGPLSHTWELISVRLAEHDSRFNRFEHERSGHDIVFSRSTEIGKLIEQLRSDKAEEYERKVIAAAVKFLKHEHHLVYLRPLLAGNLDIDRLDFINRDTRAAGVTYGDHDLDWLIRSMRFGRLPRKKLDQSGIPWVIAIDARKGINALVQYLRARENMYSLVYLHKTVRAANAHLGSILLLASRLLEMEQINEGNSPLLAYLKTARLPEGGITAIDDSDIWTTIRALGNPPDGFLSDLARRFLSRRLYKSRRICEKTAVAIKTMITDGRFGERIRTRLQITDSKEIIPDKLLCDLCVVVDNADYDVIGADKAPEEQTWIMYRRTIDIGLMPLLEYWKKTVSSRTFRDLKFVHYIPEIEADILEVVTPLEGAFTRITGGTPADEMSERGREAVEEHPPAGYRIESLLSDRGNFKTAYLGICTDYDEHARFFPGEVCVLKKYRDVEAQQVAAMRDCINNIFNISSRYLTTAHAKQDGTAIWLIERLWASDLLRLTKEAGIRTDLHFLLHMARDLFRGLADLAQKNIRHGDIKLDNCGVANSDGILLFQLGDFGLANADPIRLPPPKSLGTLTSRPPELFEDTQTVSLKSDVWSLAATIYAAAIGKYPFVELDYPRERKEVMAAEIAASLPTLIAEFRRNFDREIPPIIADILRPCLFEPPNLRPPASTVFGQLAGAVAACEQAGNEPLLWQRGLDALQVLPWKKYDPTIETLARDELRSLSRDENPWISPDLHKFSQEN